MKQLKFYDASSPEFSYTGRICRSNPTSPAFFNAGSQVTVCFTGSVIGVRIKNQSFYGETYIGYVIDGVQGRIPIKSDKTEDYIIALGLSPQIHTLILYKMQDATHWFEFFGVLTDDSSSLIKKSLPQRRMECFGDSICAGAVCEANTYVGKIDPENHNNRYDNAWYSFPMQAARILDAQLHNNAQGGLALLDGTGYFNHPQYIGLETTYDKLCYIPQCGYTPWDFSLYTPHIVLIEIGQNDNHLPDENQEADINNPENRILWKTAYKKLLSVLMDKYPRAQFILCTSVLFHDPGRDAALDEIKEEMHSERIHRLRFRRNATGTPGHPRIAEQSEMAQELVYFINTLGEDVWND